MENADFPQITSVSTRMPRLLKAGCAPRLLSENSSVVAPPAQKTFELENAVSLHSDLFFDVTGAESSQADTKFAPPACPICGKSEGFRSKDAYCAECLLKNCLKELISDKKISPAAFVKIRTILAIPKKTSKVNADRSHALINVLEKFTEEFSFAAQPELTGKEIIRWMARLPALPAVFAEIVAIQRRRNKAKSPVGKQNGAVPESEPENKAAKTAETSANLKKRRSLTALQFTEVAVRQGLYCYWCGIQVVREAQLPNVKRAGRIKNTVLFYEGGELREAEVATIDHLVRVIDGGTNESENLVISCYPCNKEREKATLRYNRPFARRKTPCRTCGGRFFHPDWGCCSICGDAPRRDSVWQELKIFAIRLLGIFSR
jgi:ribosomal protein L37E